MIVGKKSMVSFSLNFIFSAVLKYKLMCLQKELFSALLLERKLRRFALINCCLLWLTRSDSKQTHSLLPFYKSLLFISDRPEVIYFHFFKNISSPTFPKSFRPDATRGRLWLVATANIRSFKTNECSRNPPVYYSGEIQ